VFGLVILLLGVTPWQQTATGSGRVIAFAPDERRQNLDAPIEGRVLRWYVREGAVVKKGDRIVDLSDNDPDILLRLRDERDAIDRRLDAAKLRARSLETRIDALEASRLSAITAAESRSAMAKQRVSAATQAVMFADATATAAEANRTRQSSLADQGLSSQRQVELAILEATRARTEVERAKVALLAARSEVAAIDADRAKIDTDGAAVLDDARASRAAAEGEVASASAELARIEVRLARQAAQSVIAPRDGTIFQIVANGHSGEIVKAGDILAVLIPETSERAVELWLAGNDLPLAKVGAGARLQFEGWPALQVSGWPSSAVGTFGGRVALIDATDNGQGLFRVVVVPAVNEHWPDDIYLRQGVRVQGWVQLGKVKLGYELWRQFNGFPPLPSKVDPPSKGSK